MFQLFTKVVTLDCSRSRGQASATSKDQLICRNMCDRIVAHLDSISGPRLATYSLLGWSIVFGLTAHALWSQKYGRFLEVANWMTSTLHAMVTTAVGILIVNDTKHDLIYAKCDLAGF